MKLWKHVIGLIGPAILLGFSGQLYADTSDALDQLTLPQAYALANEKNHDLRASQFSVESARGAVESASASPNPTMTIQTAGINPQAGIGAGSLRQKTVDTSIRIDQLVERGGKKTYRIANASALEEAALRDLDDMQRQLHVNVAQAYYDVLAAQEKLKILKESQSLYDMSVKAAQLRQKAGDLASADVARLEVDAARAYNDALQAESDLATAQQGLALLIGVRGQFSRIRATNIWPVLNENLAPPHAFNIDQRPDVLAARSRLEAALAARNLARASRTRDVSVGVQYDHYPSSPANPQGTGNSYGISIQIPLFVHSYFEGEIRSAEAGAGSAQEAFDKTRQAAQNEFDKSWHGLQNAAERLKRFDTSLLAAAKKSSDAAEFAFKHGASGVMDVLDARRTYRAIQLDAIAAHADYAKALVNWQTTISYGNKQ